MVQNKKEGLRRGTAELYVKSHRLVGRDSGHTTHVPPRTTCMPLLLLNASLNPSDSTPYDSTPVVLLDNETVPEDACAKSAEPAEAKRAAEAAVEARKAGSNASITVRNRAIRFLLKCYPIMRHRPTSA